jgi:hypothetical protein
VEFVSYLVNLINSPSKEDVLLAHSTQSLTVQLMVAHVQQDFTWIAMEYANNSPLRLLLAQMDNTSTPTLAARLAMQIVKHVKQLISALPVLLVDFLPTPKDSASLFAVTVLFWALRLVILEVRTLQDALDVKFRVDGAALANHQFAVLMLQLLNQLSKHRPKLSKQIRTLEADHQRQFQLHQMQLLLFKLVRLIPILIMSSLLLRPTQHLPLPTPLKCKISFKQLFHLDLSPQSSVTKEIHLIWIPLIA